MISKIISLKDINKTILIPLYQRLYEWDEKQIRTLLNDILNANDDYFIGSITTRINKNDEYELIDGQQRLSTIFFLCAYMCYKNNLQKAEGEFADAFNFAYLDDECRFKMPLNEHITNAIYDYNFDNLDTNINKAFEIFNDYDLNKLNNKLFEHVKINLVILDEKILANYFINLNKNQQAIDESDVLKLFLLNLIKDDENYFMYSNILNECMQMDKIADFDTNNNARCIDDILDEKYKIQEYKSIIDYKTFVLFVFKILFKDIDIDKVNFLQNTWQKINQTKENAIKIINALKKYRIIFDKRTIRKINNEYKLISNPKDEKLELFLNYLRVARDASEYLELLLTLKDDEKLFYELKKLDDELAKKDNLDELDFNHANIAYWLQRYEYYLLQELAKNNPSYLKTYHFRAVNSKEHIYPQSKEKIDNLGNLALISDSENSVFSDKDYEKKQEIFFNYYNDGKILSLKLFDVYKNYKIWDKNSINKYELKMKRILQDSFIEFV